MVITGVFTGRAMVRLILHLILIMVVVLALMQGLMRAIRLHVLMLIRLMVAIPAWLIRKLDHLAADYPLFLTALVAHHLHPFLQWVDRLLINLDHLSRPPLFLRLLVHPLVRQ